MHNAGEFVGRILLGGPILTECLDGLAVIVGWQTRVAAFLLAGFTLLAALIFHSHFADQIQMTIFMEHLAIIGGFLVLVGRGAGPLSLEQRRQRQRA